MVFTLHSHFRCRFCCGVWHSGTHFEMDRDFMNESLENQIKRCDSEISGFEAALWALADEGYPIDDTIEVTDLLNDAKLRKSKLERELD